VRVLLADREGAARHALASLVRGVPGVVLVAEAGTREEIATAIRGARPDVIVIDDRLVMDSGAHVLAGTGPAPGPARVIVVGVDDDPAFAARAQRLGAEAWIAKDRADDQLPALLEAR
jgi:DNA-binding NarL/FixJ family response regulator